MNNISQQLFKRYLSNLTSCRSRAHIFSQIPNCVCVWTSNVLCAWQLQCIYKPSYVFCVWGCVCVASLWWSEGSQVSEVKPFITHAHARWQSHMCLRLSARVLPAVSCDGTLSQCLQNRRMLITAYTVQWHLPVKEPPSLAVFALILSKI